MAPIEVDGGGLEETALRLVLGLVLGAAALTKLALPRSSLAALATFGFAEGPLRAIAWGSLIVAELGLAVGTVLGSDLAAYGAAALMLMFAAITVSAVLQGRAGAPCACFGPRSTVSWLAVGRNLALATAFALVPSAGSLGTDGWLATGVAVALVACAGLAVAMLALAREVGMLRLQLGTQGALEIAGEGPEVASRAGDLAARLGAAETQLGLAVFTSEGCHICQTLAPAIENVANDPAVALRVFDEVADAQVWKAAAIPGSPFAVALDPTGTVLAKGTFNSLAQLESVLATAARRQSESSGAIGEGLFVGA
jgi:hypothetical protein